jgi:hypothetical protein
MGPPEREVRVRRKLQELIIAVAASPWRFALVAAVAFGSFRILSGIDAGFPTVAGGHQPFDMQNALTVDAVYPQLSAWSPAAVRSYFVFSAVDWLFPAAAGLFLAATIAACLRYAAPALWARVTGRTLLPLLLLPTAFDWLENSFALATVALYPAESAWLPAALVAAKRAKLGGLLIVQPLMLGCTAFAAGTAVSRWWHRRRAPTPRP